MNSSATRRTGLTQGRQPRHRLQRPGGVAIGGLTRNARANRVFRAVTSAPGPSFTIGPLPPVPVRMGFAYPNIA